MNPIRRFAKLISDANRGTVADPTEVEQPVAPPFTTADGQQITERQFQQEAVFDVIAQENQRRREWRQKQVRKARNKR